MTSQRKFDGRAAPQALALQEASPRVRAEGRGDNLEPVAGGFFPGIDLHPLTLRLGSCDIQVTWILWQLSGES